MARGRTSNQINQNHLFIFISLFIYYLFLVYPNIGIQLHPAQFQLHWANPFGGTQLHGANPTLYLSLTTPHIPLWSTQISVKLQLMTPTHFAQVRLMASTASAMTDFTSLGLHAQKAHHRPQPRLQLQQRRRRFRVMYPARTVLTFIV